jgi:hypothetical protein
MSVRQKPRQPRGTTRTLQRQSSRATRHRRPNRQLPWPKTLSDCVLLVRDQLRPTSWPDLFEVLARFVAKLNDGSRQSCRVAAYLDELVAPREWWEESDAPLLLSEDGDRLVAMRLITISELSTLPNLTNGFVDDCVPRGVPHEQRGTDFAVVTVMRTVIDVPPFPLAFAENVAAIVRAGGAYLIRCKSCGNRMLTTDKRQMYCDAQTCGKAASMRALRARIADEEQKLMLALRESLEQQPRQGWTLKPSQLTYPNRRHVALRNGRLTRELIQSHTFLRLKLSEFPDERVRRQLAVVMADRGVT